MKTTSLSHSAWLPLSSSKTYIFALLFVAGNVLFPMLFHAAPVQNAGAIFLPILFFTLIGAFHYGLYVGLLTAVFSPLVSFLLTGMPIAPIMPLILVKSVSLAVCAALAARYFKKISIPIIALVVISYQVIGTAVEFVLVRDLAIAAQDFIVGYPGLLIQIFAGYYLLRYLNRK